MQHDKYAARQRCSALMIQHTIDASHHICSSPKMHPPKDASQHTCITPKMQLTKDEVHQRCSNLRFTIPKIPNTKDASHQRCNALKMHQRCTKDAVYQRITMPKMQCATKVSPHQRCIAPGMHPTIDIIYQRCIIETMAQMQRTKYAKKMQRCISSQIQCTRYDGSFCCYHVQIPTRHLLVLTMLHR